LISFSLIAFHFDTPFAIVSLVTLDARFILISIAIFSLPFRCHCRFHRLLSISIFDVSAFGFSLITPLFRHGFQASFSSFLSFAIFIFAMPPLMISCQLIALPMLLLLLSLPCYAGYCHTFAISPFASFRCCFHYFAAAFAEFLSIRSISLESFSFADISSLLIRASFAIGFHY